MLMTQKLSEIIYQIDWKTHLRDWFYLTLGSLLLIVSVDMFLVPSQVSPGGVFGLAIIINELTGWPVGLSMLLLNIPMFIMGFYYLGRFKFLVRTSYAVLLYNIGVDFALPYLPPITDDLLLNALFGAVVGGIGGGLIFQGRGTAAGTSVITRVLQMKTGVPLGQVYMLIDGAIIVAVGFFLGWEIALYSMLSLFVWGVLTDYVLEGPSVIRTAFIITDKPKVISNTLFNRMKIGVTAWSGRGMFTDEKHTILFCTISRADVNTLTDIVSEADPDAFVVIGQGHQATGGVLRNSKKPAPKPLPTKKPVSAAAR